MFMRATPFRCPGDSFVAPKSFPFFKNIFFISPSRKGKTCVSLSSVQYEVHELKLIIKISLLHVPSVSLFFVHILIKAKLLRIPLTPPCFLAGGGNPGNFVSFISRRDLVNSFRLRAFLLLLIQRILPTLMISLFGQLKSHTLARRDCNM